jgi:hypothetical protein
VLGELLGRVHAVLVVVVHGDAGSLCETSSDTPDDSLPDSGAGVAAGVPMRARVSRPHHRLSQLHELSLAMPIGRDHRGNPRFDPEVNPHGALAPGS